MYGRSSIPGGAPLTKTAGAQTGKIKLESVIDHQPFVGPDQAALNQMLAQAAGGSERGRAP
jgi:hypothetical protein